MLAVDEAVDYFIGEQEFSSTSEVLVWGSRSGARKGGRVVDLRGSLATLLRVLAHRRLQIGRKGLQNVQGIIPTHK